MPINRVKGNPSNGIDPAHSNSDTNADSRIPSKVSNTGPRTIEHLRQGLNQLSKEVRAVADSLAGSIEKEFSGSAKENLKALIKRLPTLESNSSKQVRLANLLGKTIEPKTASQLLKQFHFDHTGKLLGSNGRLSSSSLNILEKSVLERSLSQTNSSGERTAPRTEREILLDIANTLNQAKATASPELAGKIDLAIKEVQSQWLHFSAAVPGLPSANPTETLLKKIAAEFSSDAPAIAKHAIDLGPEALKLKNFTQAYDNTFGRKFESELVFSLAKNTPASIKTAAAITGAWLFDQAIKLPAAAQGEFIKNLAFNLSHDPRPWHPETPEVAKFLAKPDINTLQDLLKPSSFSGFDVVKTSWVGVKAALSFPEGFKPAFKALADDNYGKVVVAARSQVQTTTSGGLKLQTEAANSVINEINRLFSARSQIPGNAANARAQQEYVRSLLDPISYSVRTPRELSKKLFEFEQNLRGKGDVEVANILLKHANHIAANPSLDDEYAVIEAPTDDVDKDKMAKQGQQFTPVQTTGYGTTLPHQRVNVGGENWGSGLSVQGKTTLNANQVKGFDRNALANEMNSVNGPSGSTNIMTFMYLQIQKENPALNLQDAFAGTMMFLTLDGGHSLPESVGTFNSITSDTRATVLNNLSSPDAAQIVANRANVIGNFKLDYGNLVNVFTNPETSAAVNNALEEAWVKTLSAFSEIHQERTNAVS